MGWKKPFQHFKTCGTSTLSREVCRSWQKTSSSQRGVPFLAEDFAYFVFGIKSNSLLRRASADKLATRVSRGENSKLRYPFLGCFILIFVVFPTISAISCYLCIDTYILTVAVSQTSWNTSVLKQKYEWRTCGQKAQHKWPRNITSLLNNCTPLSGSDICNHSGDIDFPGKMSRLGTAGIFLWSKLCQNPVQILPFGHEIKSPTIPRHWCTSEMHCYSKSTHKVILSTFYINKN